MRAYTLRVLSQLANSGKPITDKEIVVWVNEKLASADKTSNIKSFQDSSLKNAIAILDLIDAIKPGSVNYSLIGNSGSEEVGKTSKY
jgi:plastin-3